jgi:hypothetical protein
MRTKNKFYIAFGVTVVAEVVMIYGLVSGRPFGEEMVYVIVFDASILSSLYFLTQWRDELR